MQRQAIGNLRAWTALALVCASLVLFRAFVWERNDGSLKIYFLDVGQGDAIYVRTPSGKDMLIDGGPSKVLLRRLGEVMPWYDRSIDAVIATHPDADHIGGFPDLFKRYEVKSYYHSGARSDNAIDDEVMRIVEEKDVSVFVLSRGQRLDFRDGAHFDILHPYDIGKDTNSASIVGALSYGSTTVLFMGDAPSSVEARVASLDSRSVRADVLKVGHHGSKTSSGERFIESVSPAYAVISSGVGNRYGHPSKEILERFFARGIPVFRTDENGTIELVVRRGSYSFDN